MLFCIMIAEAPRGYKQTCNIALNESFHMHVFVYVKLQ